VYVASDINAKFEVLCMSFYTIMTLLLQSKQYIGGNQEKLDYSRNEGLQ